MTDDDDIVICGWVYLFVKGATQVPKWICSLTQRHHGAAHCYFLSAAIVVPHQ
jgi:hypothetical protein